MTRRALPSSQSRARAVAAALAFALVPGATFAAPLPDGEYRCDAASDTTAEFVYLTVSDGKLADFELVAVNRLRADTCQLSASHEEADVKVQKAGWRVDFANDGKPCRAAVTRDGGAFVVKVAGEGCATYCGARTYFWELRYDLAAKRCSLK